MPNGSMDWDLRDSLEEVQDRLFGTIPIVPLAADLIRAPQISRLHLVSHLGLLTGMAKANMCASRFEHTLGVYYLALIVSRTPVLRQYRDLLIAGAFLHDIGSGPYTHSCEIAQHVVMGGDHETVLPLVLDGSPVLKVLRKHGIAPEDAIALVQGRYDYQPIRELINGSFDLDTIEGTLRYWLMLHNLRDSLPYDPQCLAEHFTVRNEQIALQGNPQVLSRELLRWENCRERVYNYIHSPEIAAPEAMLTRALDFAIRENEIKPKFFGLIDYEATKFLRTKCNKRTRTLVGRTTEWPAYVQIYHRAFSTLSPEQAQLMSDSSLRFKWADQLAETLGVPPEDICIHVGRHKGRKDIGFPIVDYKGKSIGWVPSILQSWFVHVYANPDVESRCRGLHYQTQQFMNHKLLLK